MNKELEKVYQKSPEQLLKENGIPLEPPIDLDLLVNQLGIIVREHDFSSIEKAANIPADSILGATLSLDNLLIIMFKKYSEKRNRHGERFTIAHELAHCALHANNLEINHLELRNEICNKDIPKEVDANKYAGELLIPETSLKKIYNRLLIPSLKTLSEIFDVSAKVMEKRLDILGMNYYKDTKANI